MEYHTILRKYVEMQPCRHLVPLGYQLSEQMRKGEPLQCPFCKPRVRVSLATVSKHKISGTCVAWTWFFYTLGLFLLVFWLLH